MHRVVLILALALPPLIAGCGGSSGQYAAEEDTLGTGVGRAPRVRDRGSESVFGEGGFALGTASSGGGTISSILSDDAEREGIPVNRYLWEASLDTLSFLPLASTDPFTGVIATDWGATPDAPGERFKVTAYVVSSDLAASSLRVAVFREVLNDANVWVPAAVAPETPRQIEDAILTRARQIRLAEVEAEAAG